MSEITDDYMREMRAKTAPYFTFHVHPCRSFPHDTLPG